MHAKRAVELLETCDQGLRKLIADAAGAGDLASVRRIANWVETLQAMVSEAKTTGAATASPRHEPAAATQSGRPRRQTEEYPKFFRRGDELVKVGWSKKERKEYNHRAPRRAVDVLAAVVKQLGARGKLFTSDDILPLKDPTDGSEFPAYQGYVALAWLKHLNLVEQHGRRGGYSLVSAGPIDGTIAAALAELPEWRG